ncbi:MULTISPECIES: hypothetical protein [Mesorhizobium]|jgi:hypothetical protein|uniref:Lipoprotein n=2 Tax=Mesorhizobium TaxID=68287 RepID=A0A1G8TGF2_9HYPH|nr:MULTISPECIES: hypothetical protein [Mesorhizobium]ESZ15080.1 hypothetical protein X737_23405 [Mesorhizobium sp. L48C026A00]MCF6101542.1 hypothetical protein [Mesorhizobium muleiense]MCF6111183.1 hypothetical protein [Mesorhizobium muleiense]MCF6120450.1 hypothetical protein [Mesorhizobium muleiense]RWB98301.1 MAG: hypothetical protein EOQ56_20855 [Mesorhizobium sp.]
MKTFLLVAVGIAALAGSACSKAPDCTTEMLTKKAQDMTAALQEAITKDPAKAADLTAKVQAVTTKYQGATTAEEACKAYDELTAAIKA